MQNRPDRSELLDAVARFLGEQVVLAVPDRSVAFRVRIAAWLVEVVARELASEEAHDLNEIRGLVALLGAPPVEPTAGRSERAEQTGALRAQLARHIRDDELDAAGQAEVLEHMKRVLADRLSVVQPRFDLRADVEDERPR